jgi:hypothetical protein
MNLYRYRVVERTTTTIIGDDESVQRIEYYVQQSLLGIMWVDIVDKHSIPYWAFPQGAIEQYNKLTKKQIIKDKVVHPIK